MSDGARIPDTTHRGDLDECLTCVTGIFPVFPAIKELTNGDAF
jgi:hypothetical protein